MSEVADLLRASSKSVYGMAQRSELRNVKVRAMANRALTAIACVLALTFRHPSRASS